jgi:NAD-dependent SIR2 family protein deacetylase
MEKAIFKFNGGLGALLCSKCRVIIKTGKDFSPEEIKAIKGKVPLPPAQYCNDCNSKQIKKL